MPLSRRRSALGLLVGALGVGALAALAPVAGLDIWWHLRVGERLVHAPGWLPVDTLGDGAFGAPWPYKDVLADVLLYACHSLGGDAALSVLPALVAALVVATLGLGARARAAPRSWLLALGAAALGAALHRLHARPMLFSLLAFAALLPTLERWLRAGDQRGRMRAALGVLALVALWAWLHRGVVLGVATVGVAGVAGPCWLVWTRRPRAETSAAAPPPPLARALGAGAALVAAAAVVVTLTPSGLATWTTALGLLGGASYRAHVSEWAPMPLGDLLGHHATVVPLWALAAWALWRRRRAGGDALDADGLFLAALTLGLGVAVFVSARWLPYAAIAAARLAVPARRPLAEVATARAGARFGRALAPLALAAALLALYAERPLPLGVGPLAGRYPEAALRFADDAGLLGSADAPARPVNAYDFGGWLLWHAYPRLRPSVDGRADMVYPPDVFAEAMAAERDAAAFVAMQRRSPRSWVLARQDGGGRTFGFLAGDPAWTQVFWSAPAVVYVRRDAHTALATAAGFRYFRRSGPEGLDAEAFAVAQAAARRGEVEVAAAELARMAAASPESVAVAVAGVVFWHALGAGRLAERDAALDALVAAHGDHRAVRALLVRLASSGGR